MPGLSLGDVVPNIEANTTHGRIKLRDYIGNNWVIVFSHPADFTPVCTTEVGQMAKYGTEFQKRGVKLLGVSGDTVDSHKSWIKDVEALSDGSSVAFPIMADPELKILRELNMVDPDEKDPQGKPTASRALHIIGPDKRLKLSFLYPGTTGRNMEEIMRVLDSLQLAYKHNQKIATPVNWKPGDKVVIAPSVSNEEAKKFCRSGFNVANLPSGGGYLRFAQVE